MSNFKKWPKTKRFTDSIMTITQKMDGTNGQILFEEVDATSVTDVEPTYATSMSAGSRNRWLTPYKDNFKFLEWCQDHYDILFETLGLGRHYGEFCGPGIQTGEGLDAPRFFSFNPNLILPSHAYGYIIQPVPLLYEGPPSLYAVFNALDELRKNGSKVNGFNKPEGVIVQYGGSRTKVYLDQADTIARMASSGGFFDE